MQKKTAKLYQDLLQGPDSKKGSATKTLFIIDESNPTKITSDFGNLFFENNNKDPLINMGFKFEQFPVTGKDPSIIQFLLTTDKLNIFQLHLRLL